MNSRQIEAILAALCVVASPACLRTAEPNNVIGCAAGPDLGSFDGAATGAAADTLSGCAYYSIDVVEIGPPPQSDFTFGMVLTNGDPKAASHKVKVYRKGGRPGAGTYSVGPVLGQLYGSIIFGGRSFTLSGGSLVVTRSATLLEGSINLTATEIGGTATITIAGAFFARCVDRNAVDVDDDEPDPQPRSGTCTTGSAS